PTMMPQERSAQDNNSDTFTDQMATDLWTNADQFKNLYNSYFYKLPATVPQGAVTFLGINCDPIQYRDRVAEVLMDQPWPWSNCMYADTTNQAQLSSLTTLGAPVMMIVGTEGTIRYMGPVGGFLPQMLLKQELEKVTPAKFDVKGMMSNLLSGGLKTKATTSNTAAASRATDESNESIQPEPVKPEQISIEDNPSIIEAQKLLEVAQLQKRFSPLSALEKCDEIMERWPNSLEAEKAKVLIQSILRNRPQFKKAREQAGKYTGD
ncbi:MAG: hypothetical protein JW860_09640, partial [Sedimentisphaerales bacterium]|nr:hypothetical protein [Sedimentisphaerales bacterium]